MKGFDQKKGKKIFKKNSFNKSVGVLLSVDCYQSINPTIDEYDWDKKSAVWHCIIFYMERLPGGFSPQ